MKKGKLSIKSSLCKECGYCCYQCGFLGEEGCTNKAYAANTICESFPAMFGIPELLGYQLVEEKGKEKGKERWFLISEKNCKILNDKVLFHALRKIINAINDNPEKEVNAIVNSRGHYLKIIYSPQ